VIGIINSPQVTPSSPRTPVSLYDRDVVSPAPSSSSSIDESNQPRRVYKVRSRKEQEKRARNNEASRKCRREKKNKFQEMEQQIVDLENENRLLRRKINSLGAW